MTTYEQSEKPHPSVLDTDPEMLEKTSDTCDHVITDRFIGHEDSAVNKALLRKQDFRLIPICATMYLLAVRLSRERSVHSDG